MKLPSPIHARRARIEIVPLIDVMFFLLAAFLMVSLRLDRTQNIRVALPSAQKTQADFDPGMIQLSVDRAGAVWFERRKLSAGELLPLLTNRPRLRKDTAVYIGGDRDTRHADMAHVLGEVRAAGFQKVAFLVEETPTGAPR